MQRRPCLLTYDHSPNDHFWRGSVTNTIPAEPCSIGYYQHNQIREITSTVGNRLNADHSFDILHIWNRLKFLSGFLIRFRKIHHPVAGTKNTTETTTFRMVIQIPCENGMTWNSAKVSIGNVTTMTRSPEKNQITLKSKLINSPRLAFSVRESISQRRLETRSPIRTNASVVPIRQNHGEFATTN